MNNLIKVPPARILFSLILIITGTASADTSSLTGIDVSKFQGEVDFQRVKDAGVDYVFIRATEGVTIQDVDFHTNLREAKAAGLVVGAYHFYETDDTPAEQFKNYTDMVELEAGSLPPVIDIEKVHDQHDRDITGNIRTFLHSLEAHYGVKPIIYTGLNFSNKHLTELGDFPLWIAEYNRDAPVLPDGWSSWTFWQWTQEGSVDGIDGSVDADRFNGDVAKFERLLMQ